MDTLFIMSAPSQVNTSRDVALDALRAIVAARPGITWGELAVAARNESSGDIGLGCPGGGALNGWLTNALKVVGGAGDSFTFGGTSKVLFGLRDIGESVFSTKEVGDSLKEAGRGIFDDAMHRFLDSLPFGIGKDYKTGYVVNRYWMMAALAVAGFFVWKMFAPRRGRR